MIFKRGDKVFHTCFMFVVITTWGRLGNGFQNSWLRAAQMTNAPSTTTVSPRNMADTSDIADSSVVGTCWSEDRLRKFALDEGINMTLSTLGPGYRAIARSTHNESQILGYCEGFVRPSGNILHLDKMEVFQKMVIQAQKENPAFVKGGTLFGPGLLLGFLCLLHGHERGCTIAEFLAIDDEEKQHRRLVRYYERVGFKIIKYVGDDFADIPDRMVWGGCGTLMKENVDTLLLEWTAMLEKRSTSQSID